MLILPVIMNDAERIEDVLCYRDTLTEEEREQFYSAGEEFVECLQNAIKETLKNWPRDEKLFFTVYNFEESFISYKKAAQEFGISKERVRQILERSCRKVRYIKGQNATERKKLAQLLNDICLPDSENCYSRMLIFAIMAFPDQPTMAVLKLLAYLVFGVSEKGKEQKKNLAKGYSGFCSQNESNQYKKSCDKELKQQSMRALADDENSWDIIWPQTIELMGASEPISLMASRTVNPHGWGISGTFFSEKLNREIQYESRLERRFYKKLEQMSDVVAYQEQPCEIKYWHEGREKTYFPDCVVILSDGRRVYVEIKPLFTMAEDQNVCKWHALKNFCEKNGFGCLMTTGTRSINHYFEQEYSEAFEIDILKALDEAGSLSWPEYNKIKAQHKTFINDLCTIVLKNDLKFNTGPFHLERRCKTAGLASRS